MSVEIAVRDTQMGQLEKELEKTQLLKAAKKTLKRLGLSEK